MEIPSSLSFCKKGLSSNSDRIGAGNSVSSKPVVGVALDIEMPLAISLTSGRPIYGGGG